MGNGTEKRRTDGGRPREEAEPLPSGLASGRLASVAAAALAGGLPLAAAQWYPAGAGAAAMAGGIAGMAAAWASWGGVSRLSAALSEYAAKGGSTPPPPGWMAGAEAGRIGAAVRRLIFRVRDQASEAKRKELADSYTGKTLLLLDAMPDPAFWIGKSKGSLVVTWANTAARRIGVSMDKPPPGWLGDPMHSGAMEGSFDGEGRHDPDASGRSPLDDSSDMVHFEFVKREVDEKRGKGRGGDEYEPVIAVIGRDVSERRAREAAEARKAITCNLTGIQNRGGFNREVAKVGAGGRPFSLIYIDLDKFKPVNDTHGHPAGDALLIEVAKLLGKTLGKAGIPFRLGGDEFAVLLPGAGYAETEEIAKRIVRVCNVPFDLKPAGSPEVTVQIGASVGCACLPQHAPTADLLLKAADAAMYACKKKGRNQHSFPD